MSTHEVSIEVRDTFYVDVNLKDIVKGLSDKGKSELLALLHGWRPQESAEPVNNSKLIEEAYLYALRNETPQVFKDLLWRVHGRAC